MVNDAETACIPEPGFPVPFPFLFMAVCFALLVLGSYIRDKISTKIYSCLIALITCSEPLIYGLIIAYSG